MREMQNKNYFYNLLNAFPDYPNPNFHQIELDLHRTFPDELEEDGVTPSFHVPEAIKYIKNVMVAYTKRNPVIGYCQGMNFVMARFYKYLPDEEQAFWLFTQLVENILPIDFYT